MNQNREEENNHVTNSGASSSLIDVVPPHEEQEASGDITFQKSPPAQRCLGEPKTRNRNTKATRFAAVPRLSIVPQDIFCFTRVVTEEFQVSPRPRPNRQQCRGAWNR